MRTGSGARSPPHKTSTSRWPTRTSTRSPELHLDPELARHIEEAFEPGPTVRYMLHPPPLRAMGLGKKVAFGRTTRPAFRALRAMRRLRGARFDPFGATA